MSIDNEHNTSDTIALKGEMVTLVTGSYSDSHYHTLKALKDVTGDDVEKTVKDMQRIAEEKDCFYVDDEHFIALMILQGFFEHPKGYSAEIHINYGDWYADTQKEVKEDELGGTYELLEAIRELREWKA